MLYPFRQHSLCLWIPNQTEKKGQLPRAFSMVSIHVKIVERNQSIDLVLLLVSRLDLARFVRVPGRASRSHPRGENALVTGLVRRFEESLLPEPLSSGVARSFVGTRSGVARRTASGVGRAARRAVGRMGRVRQGGKLGRSTVRRGGRVKGEMKTTAATARRRKGWPTVWHTQG